MMRVITTITHETTAAAALVRVWTIHRVTQTDLPTHTKECYGTQQRRLC